MTDRQSSYTENDLHFLPDQQVAVNDFPARGLILDLGGGGEGVIGQLKSSQVVAIDISRRELQEAGPGPIQLIMDGSLLGFREASFSTAACFFSLMYIPVRLHQRVFQEIHRVLQPGGKLYFWDMTLPAQENRDLDLPLVAFRLSVNLPGQRIQTGYGTPWPSKKLGKEHYQTLAASCGLRIEHQQTSGMCFHIQWIKPQP